MGKKYDSTVVINGVEYPARCTKARLYVMARPGSEAAYYINASGQIMEYGYSGASLPMRLSDHGGASNYVDLGKSAGPAAEWLRKALAPRKRQAAAEHCAKRMDEVDRERCLKRLMWSAWKAGRFRDLGTAQAYWADGDIEKALRALEGSDNE